MSKIFLKANETKMKNAIIITLIVIATLSTYYFHLVLNSSVIFTHFYYIPIILACIWWNRKGILVALLLSGNLLCVHLIYGWHVTNTNDILRAVMFVVIAFLIVSLREETVKAEVESQVAKKKTDQIFSTTGDGLQVIDRNFNITQFNEGFLKLLGITKEDAMGKKCFQVFSGPLCNTPECILKRILDGEERIECDIEKELLNGRKAFCLLTATPIKGPNGEVIGIIEDLKNITDRKMAEQALQESEEIYRSFVKNFKGIAYQVDTNFKPLFFHGAVESITGYTEDDFIAGQPKWMDIVHNDDLYEIYRISRQLNKVPNFFCERKYRIIDKDGNIKWVEEIIHNICNISGKPYIIQGIIYDITERKQTEEALRKSEERLLQSQKMEAVGRLAGGIAHDFNNLITIITGNSDLLMDEIEKNNPFHDSLEEIYKAGVRASSLTRQLLAFSRRQMLQPKIFDLNVIVGEIQSLLKRLIGEDIELITELDPNLSRVKADPGQIEQVILNLVVNARDAMPHGGTLTIKTENTFIDEENSKINPETRPGRFVCLTVEDTGIGMNKETLDKIFEPFFSTKAQGEGTGLGLATVYGIIKQHDGFTTVYSEPGHGSTFKTYLPALLEKHDGEPKEVVSLDKFQGEGERILLVEDDDGVRRFARKVLEKNGYVVFEAINAEQAVSLFEHEKGDFYLVLSDVVLPDLNGVQLVDKLQGQNPDLEVILCSGYSDQKSQWQLICERNIRFLKKPYNKFELLRAIKDLKTQAGQVSQSIL